jgi:hypothetical protein
LVDLKRFRSTPRPPPTWTSSRSRWTSTCTPTTGPPRSTSKVLWVAYMYLCTYLPMYMLLCTCIYICLGACMSS